MVNGLMYACHLNVLTFDVELARIGTIPEQGSQA